METLNEYLETMPEIDKREKLESIINWILEEFPQLNLEIKWNQPMFIDHGTFIIAISFARHHMSVSPEKVILDRFAEEIKTSKYKMTKMLFHIKYVQEVDYNLLRNIINASIEEKKDYDKFWL